MADLGKLRLLQAVSIMALLLVGARDNPGLFFQCQFFFTCLFLLPWVGWQKHKLRRSRKVRREALVLRDRELRRREARW